MKQSGPMKPAKGKPRKRTLPIGKPKPLPPQGSSKKQAHPSALERVDLIGRKTRAGFEEIRRKGGK